MNETFVAIGRGSLYPESRGDLVKKDVATSEIKQSETVGEKGREYQKITKEELRKRLVAERERKRLLEKGRKEAEKSAEAAKEQARKVTRQIRQAPSVAEAVQREVEPQVPSKENPVIVSNFPHLANQPREVAQVLLEKSGVSVELPAKWDKMNGVEKERWLDRNGIIDTASLPDFDERTLEAGFVHKVKVKGREIGLYKRRGKDEYVVGGLPPREWKCETFTRIFKNTGIDIEIPVSFDGLPFEDKVDLLERLGIRVLPGIYHNVLPPAGFGPRSPDNATLSAADAFERLEQLRKEQEAFAGVPTPGVDINIDIQQILERINAIPVHERILDYRELRTPELIVNRLREIQYIETQLGAAFNAVSFNAERNELYRRLLAVNNNDGRINDVLGRLLRFELAAAAGPFPAAAQAERQVWLSYLDHIKRYVNARRTSFQDYRFVYNAAKEIEDFEKLQTAAGNIALFNNFLSQQERRFFGQVRGRIGRHFKRIEAAHTSEELKLIYDPVDKEAFYYRKSLGSYIGSVKDVEGRLFESSGAVRSAEQNESPGERGLVEWHTVNTLVEMDKQQAGENELNVPLTWQDSLKNVTNNLRFIESGDFSADDLGPVRQRIVSIAESLRQRIADMKQPGQQDERKRAEAMLNEINEVKDAVLALYDLRLAMEASDMNPQKVVEHFGSHIWKDTTFKVYFERFDKDEDGKAFVDGRGQSFNMQDKAMQMFYRRLHEEKLLMNKVEALTIVDIIIPIAVGDSRLDDMARLMGRQIPFSPQDIADFERLRQELVTRMGPNVNLWANPDARGIIRTDVMKFAIADWYKESTFLGAFGTYTEEESRRDGYDPAAYNNQPDPNIGKQRTDIFRTRMLGEFKDKLLNVDRVDVAKVDEYERFGLLNQVMNNAYHLTWIQGAFSDYDGVRVWDRSKIWFRNRQRGEVYQLGQYVFNNGTTWFNGRMVDHYTEFLQDEVRGRPRDANHLFTSHMLGKKRGILGHNRLVVKMIADNLSNARAVRDSLVVQDQIIPPHGGLRSFNDILTEKMQMLENVDKLNIGKRIMGPYRDWDTETNNLNRYENGWAKGAAIEELLEDGQISLENVEWSKVFSHDAENVRKFNMGDWWGDRSETHKYFAAGALQEYLKNPGTKMFFQMNKDVFYSKREIRIQPWMKIVIPAHQAIGRHWQEWWGMPYDMAHAETENVINEAVRLNMLDYNYKEAMKARYVGSWPFKQIRFTIELADRNAREFVKRDWELFLFFPLEFFKVAGQQMVAQATGK